MLGRIRERLAAAWGALEEDPGPIPADGASLRAAFERLVGHVRDRAETVSDRERAAAEAQTEAREERAALLREAGLAPDLDVTQASTEAQVVAAGAEERVRGWRRRSPRGPISTSVPRSRWHADDRAPAARRPATLPVPRVAARRGTRGALRELASTHFEELTDGDYRFAEDDTFRIVDRNAGGAIRDPDSLSGGETFLASLALALALADMVTRGGGRLDSFFLDEGFGSLDPEHIERAMRGIEHLVGSGGDRLVILVSHVEQMHELLEDLIVLDKDETPAPRACSQGRARPRPSHLGDDVRPGAGRVELGPETTEALARRPADNHSRRPARSGRRWAGERTDRVERGARG